MGLEFFNPRYDINTACQLTFNDFIKRISSKWLWNGCGVPSADNWCYNEDGKCLVTKIYKIETLTKEIIQKDIIKYTGIHYDIPKIGHLNSTKTVNYRDFYTEQWMIDKVSEVYKKDIELGNYKF